MIPVYIYFACWLLLLLFLAWWRLTWWRRHETRINILLQVDSTDFDPWLRYKIDCVASRRMDRRLTILLEKDKEAFRKEMENW